MSDNNSRSFLERWSRFFIERYKVTILLIVAIIIGGVWGIQQNQKQDFPSIPTNYIVVTAQYIGASSADVEQQVIIPVEQAVTGVDGVKNIRSSATENFGSIFVEMDDVLGTPDAAIEIENLITKTSIPAEVETDVEVIDPVGPSVVFAMVDGGKTKEELLDFSQAVKTRLEGSSTDIKRVDIAPENDFEVQVLLDADEMAVRGIAQAQVRAAIQSFVTELPGGSVKTDDGRTKSVNVVAPVESLDELASLPIGAATLSDIAEIQRVPSGSDALTLAGFVRDGQPLSQDSVYFLVYKTDDGDVIRVSESVMAEVEEIQQDGVLPEGTDLVTLYDSSPFIQDQIEDLSQNGLIGLLVILIVLLFFINLRTSLVVALIIPVAFLVTFFTLWLIGFSINILTLFAMILTLGILVDNAIVIAEGIVHNMRKLGLEKVTAILKTVREIGPAITAATVTTIIAFIPFASIGGIIGEFMKFIPFTIIIMLAASYVLAVTITPVFGKWILKGGDQTPTPLRKWQKWLVIPVIVRWGQCVIDSVTARYSVVMRRIYDSRVSRVVILVVTGLLIVGSIGFFGSTLEYEQFPTDDGNLIQVSVDLPTGTPFEEYESYFEDVNAEMIELPYFESLYTFQGVVYAQFTQPADRADKMTIFEITDQLNERLSPLRETLPEGGEIEAKFASYGPPEGDYDVIIELRDNDLTALGTAADDLVTFVGTQENVEEVVNSQVEDMVPSVKVTFDDDALKGLAVDPMIAQATINATFSESTVGSIVTRADGVSDDIVLAFGDSAKDTLDDLRGLLVPSATRGVVELSDVANVEEMQSLNAISRLNQKRVASVYVDLTEDGDKAVVETAIKDYLTEDKLEQLGLEADGVEYGGIAASQAEDFENLTIVFLLAIIFVYLVLVYQFNSFGQPFLIMFTVPIALIGVFPGLHIVGSSLNMISGLGVIALVGVVVNDAIVFFDYMNRYRRENPELPISEILVKTGEARFKPIFSTSITTIGGVLPITLADPFWTGLGTSIIAGLIFSTAGTLVAIPVLMSFFVRKKKRA